MEQLRLVANIVAIILFLLAGWPQMPHSPSLLAFGLAFLGLAHLAC